MPTTPIPTPAPSAVTATDKAKTQEKTAAITPIKPEDIPKVQHPPSPLLKQHQDRRGQPDYTPVSIIILTGEYKGKVIDLGLAVEEISQSQSAEWSDHSNQSIRVGANFSRISAREISLQLTFFDIGKDIAHLGENLAHLQEIQPTEKTPPLLMLKQGSVTAVQCVCTSIRWKYDTPHPAKKGYRKVEVELSFKLLGGKSSPDASGVPLTGTPLQAERGKQTDIEAILKGNADIADLLLAPCLGDKGSQQIRELIEKQRLNDIDQITKIDDDAFLQGAIAGIFNKAIYSNPKFIEKLDKAMAVAIATKEQGLTREERFQVANAILKNDPKLLPARLSGLWDKMSQDYKVIKDSIAKQDYKANKKGESNSPIFKDPSTADRFRQIGHCGLSLLQVGGDGFSNPLDSKTDQEMLTKINEAIVSKSDEELMKTFGLSSKVQLSKLKNGAPYTSKADFWNRSTGSVVGITGMVIWQNFENAQPVPTPAPEKK